MGLKFKTLRQKVIVDAAPGEVFDAYVDPKKHAEFTGSPAKGTPKAGGKFTTWDGYAMGKYIELERGKRVRHEWTTTEWPDGYPPSILELTFAAKGKKTELTMVHSMVPEQQADGYAQGWEDYYWRPLKAYFAGKR